MRLQILGQVRRVGERELVDSGLEEKIGWIDGRQIRHEADIDQEFAGEPIDLVIDDASHYYEHSRRSFEIVFPRLREGRT